MAARAQGRHLNAHRPLGGAPRRLDPRTRVLVLPGYRGSGPAHWQTWLEAEEPRARRIGGIDWDAPVLAHWTRAVEFELQRSTAPAWLVAHSFCCLVAAVVAARNPARLAGLLLVAPADPARFTAVGVRGAWDPAAASLEASLPQWGLTPPALLIASRSDPWMTAARAETWAQRWGADFVDIGDAGHINVDSGHGPWPFGLELVRTLAFGATRETMGLPLHRARHAKAHAPGAVAPQRYALNGPSWLV